MYEYVPCTCGACGGRKRAPGAPGTGVTDGCEPSCGCWESSPDPLPQQPVLLTTEPALQPKVLLLTASPWRALLDHSYTHVRGQFKEDCAGQGAALYSDKPQHGAGNKGSLSGNREFPRKDEERGLGSVYLCSQSSVPMFRGCFYLPARPSGD